MDPGPFDLGLAAEAIGAPGIDPRRWACYGVVSAETGTQKSVYFTDENGGPLPYPVVMVDLQPSGESVPCRVGYHVAGNQEGEWIPFVAGDEVLVLVPMGDESHQPCIVARFNQSKDTFPALVAGMDTTQNNLAFRRVMTPFVFETVAAYLVRNANTGSFFTLDASGDALLANGNLNALHLGSDFVGLMLGDNTAMVQLLPAGTSPAPGGNSNSALLLQGNAAQMIIGDEQAFLLTPGTLNITTAGGGYAPGHAITLEQFLNLVNSVVTLLGPLFTVPLTPAQITAIINGAIAATASGPTASITDFTQAINTALAVPPDPTGAAPGVGRPGFTI